MNEDQEKTFSQCVASAIKAGDVSMRPRWWFLVRGILFVAGTFLAGLVLLYLVSLIIFVMRQNGAGFAPAFGLRGWLSFARNLPWLLVLCTFGFIAIFEMVVRRYQFAYRRPIVYSAIAVIFVAILGGFAVVETPLHTSLVEFVKHNKFEFDLYRDEEAYSLPDIYRGFIVATTSDGFIVENRRGTSTVSIDELTTLPMNFEIVPGNAVIIFGDVTTGTIKAFGVRISPMKVNMLQNRMMLK
jgi:hypothetical protein